tara:strand:+ start:387 stop:1139 length:753 start_codon:yes stop_codon:yes gene_type:complete
VSVTLGELERKKLVDLAEPTLWTKDGSEALKYLRGRNLTDKVIKDFRLGYVPHWIKNKEGQRHWFAGRIIFPLFDQYNELISVSSRDWRLGASMKFLHEAFDKGNYLYGLNVAKKSIIKSRKVVLVEGELDVMSLHAAGIGCTVGILGSAPQMYQISILSRYCREMFFVFDRDESGEKALERSMKLYEDKKLSLYGIKFVPVRLPSLEELGLDPSVHKKTDPDIFIKKKSKSDFVEMLKESRFEIENVLR